MPKPANRKTIAVDIDDVLAANAEAFIEFSNERWGTNLTPDDYTEHWAEMWDVDHAEADSRGDVIFEERIFLKHRFFDEAKPVLRHLTKRYNLVVASSRNARIQKETTAWITKEYSGIFSAFHFADIWHQREISIDERNKMTKAVMLKEIGADYLIDDQPKHCLAAAEAGLTSLLFGDYRWNRDIKLPKNVYRAKTWQTVQEFFDAAR
jgi:5'(3')-deoxyribonucleotidase